MKGLIQILAQPFRIGFLLCLCALGVSGQSISGKVQEKDGKPLPFVNLLLLRDKDSTLVKGAVSEASGAYTIDHVRSGTYLLSASMIGYQRAYVPHVTIAEGQSIVKMPMLILSPETKQLQEVAVTARRPFVEQQIDRTIVNVANSIIASGSTALEVLEKAPGVAVDRQNDQLQLLGKNGVIVQIDGKQTYLSMAEVVAMLKSMPSDNIDRIELITNPSARYDAAGNSGIINIRLRKNENVGTNGTLSLAGGSGRYDRERGSIQFNHRTTNMNLFGSFSANRGGNYWHFINQRNQVDQAADPEGERTIIHQDSYIRFRERGQNAKAGLDFFLNKTTTIGVVWTGFWSNNREESPAEASFRREENGPVYLQTTTHKSLSNIFSNQAGNLNFQHTFAQKGQLTADFDLGHFSRDFTNSLTTRTLFSEAPPQPLTGLFTHLPATIDIRTAKADYNQALSGGWKMEAGLKSSSVHSDNALTLSQGLAENLQRDDTLSNHFQYTELVNAAYASFSGKIAQKTELLLGLRAEHTHSVGHSLTLLTLVTRDYLNVFPSLFISRALTSTHTLTFSYSYRIDRPNYQNLNPARSYVDPYFYSAGNPYLKPQYTQSLELKHSFKKQVFTSLGASFIHDFVFFLNRPVSSSTFDRMPENIGQSQVYNLTFSSPVTLSKGWNMQITLLGTFSRFQYSYLGAAQSVQQVSARLNGSSTLALGKGWTAELTGWLNTPEVVALRRSPWRGTFDAGLQKSFGTQLKARLSVQDVLHTNRILAKLDTPALWSDTRILMDTRIAMLNLTYSFGNQKLKSERQRRIGSEEEIRRTNQ